MQGKLFIKVYKYNITELVKKKNTGKRGGKEREGEGGRWGREEKKRNEKDREERERDKVERKKKSEERE